MKIKILLIAGFILLFVKFAFFFKKFTPQNNSLCPPATRPFPSYDENFAPTERWCLENPQGKVFQLSQNYAEARSSAGEELPWKRIVKTPGEFKAKWRDYLLAVLRYAYAGNLETDWQVQENRQRKWFHAPWMHTGATGREFLRGLTAERPSCAKELREGKICDDDKLPIENWAVSVYNEPGAYYINRIWTEMLKQNPNPANFPAEGFPEGTVAVKLLFTQSEQKFLRNSVAWQADIYRGKMPPQTVRLLQIDVAVRDSVSPTGWVFGTFVYHDDAPPIAYNAELPSDRQGWLRVVPLGLMFGNELNESFLNSDVPVPQHFGCKMRLNGPVDNPKSSCMACHAQSEMPQDLDFNKLNLSYPPMSCDAATDKFWFKNVNPRSDRTEDRTLSAPDAQAVSLDFSLQLREGIERCCRAKVCRCK
ncbi:MAG: hypothetical protein ACR2HG_16060 [Pyrinomonadaceae bacterium]